MEIKQDKYDVGVIVGRFQVPQLHPSHKELIQFVVNKHPKVIILLGVPGTLGTRENPLDFEMRKQMILTDFPNVNVLLANDCVSDEIWSKNLDSTISSVTTPNQKVVLYGGRDSFMGHYKGRFPTVELDSGMVHSGTEIRKEASVKAINSSDFRSGVVWAYYNQYARVMTTVDMAIVKKTDKVELLMARKPNEKLIRFVGGFAEPDSECFELDAIREVSEEVGVEITYPKYLGSFKVKDWRYKNGVDKVKTLFFYCEYVFGKAEAKDDIADCQWFDISKMKSEDIVVEHRPLFECLVAYLITSQKG